jgi:hypothetical protein
LVDSNCFQSTSTLSVDTIYNSTYAWFRKENYNSTDSIYLGGGYTVFVPFLSASDTGTFICHIAVNNGCVKRTYVYNLTGLCYLILPVKFTSFTGKFINDKIALNWKTHDETDLKYYIIERKIGTNLYGEIGRVNSRGNSPGAQQYDFVDMKPGDGKANYRLKLVYRDNSITYSEPVTLSKSLSNIAIHCYPNPVTNELVIGFEVSGRHNYKVKLLNMVNQGVFESTFSTTNNGRMIIPRTKIIQKGIYILKVIDLNTQEEFAEKIIFL